MPLADDVALAVKTYNETGNKAEAARILGIPVTTLKHRLDIAARDGEVSVVRSKREYQRVLVIPDTQCKPGIDLTYLDCIGKYIQDKQFDCVVHLGDHADMPSLSSYDKGKRQFEGRRYKADIQAAIEGNERIWSHVKYSPDSHILYGNHEHRIVRALDYQPELDGVMGLDDLRYSDYYKTVHPFLSVAKIGGIAFSHYFYAPNSGKPYGGTAHTKLKNIGMSYVMGHQQGLDVALRELPDGTQQIGIVAGSCYEHDEEYRGYQANGHWRGIVVLHECDGTGRADPMFVSIDYLRRKYG